MTLSRMFEDLALKIGSDDNDIVKAIKDEPENEVAKAASKALTEVIKFLFSAADVLSEMQKSRHDKMWQKSLTRNIKRKV